MNRSQLYLVVSVSGACVLAIEILGTRILGPFYGVSIFLWSALISVTLAALSLGYAIGGRWADRGPRASRLAFMLAGAGVWMLLVPWLARPLLSITEPLGLRTAVLASAMLLFFPPLTLLGMVSPYAIRLSAERLEEVGRTAGNLYAVSTLASVFAAIATGFWLIPNIGVTKLTLGVGVLLVAAGLIAYRAQSRSAASVTAALVIALLAGGAALSQARDGAGAGDNVRFVGQSAYAEIRVIDRRELRYLIIDGGVHTIVEPEGWKPRQSYVQVGSLAMDFFDEPGDMLLVGLGGGATARAFARRGWHVEAVEIDPVVARVAREYFGLTPADATVHLMDGRRFLMTTDHSYDVVFLDAFGSSSIPFHLVTTEVFGLIKSRLRTGGVLAMNIETEGWHHPLAYVLLATLHRHFSHVVALPIAEPPDKVGNVVLLASDRPLELRDDQVGDPVASLSDEYEHWRVLQRAHGWQNQFTPHHLDRLPIFTDDLNPVDVWAESVNRAARRELHEFFGPGIQSW